MLRRFSAAGSSHPLDDPDLPAATSACLHASTREHLRRCWPLRDGARRMIPALVAVDHRGPGLGDADSAGGGGAVGNPLGFRTGQARRPGTLLDFVCAEKEKYPDKVLLVLSAGVLRAAESLGALEETLRLDRESGAPNGFECSTPF